MVTIRFFAVLKKLLDRDSMHIQLTGPATLKTLLDRIESEIPSIRSVIKEGRTLIAVNQEIAQDETVVSDGDEVAFLPPFAGGQH
jgi:MoaD family protein